MKRLASALLILILAPACGELPHDGAFDPEAPAELQAKATLTGTVTLEGESDAAGITVELQGAARTYSVQTGADGAFRLAGVTPGLYDVVYKTRYFVEQADTYTVPLGAEVVLPARRLLARRAVVTGSALIERLANRVLTQVGGAEIFLEKTASVRAGEAAAPPAWRRAATGVDSFSLTALAGDDGTFTLSGVPAGVYRLVITGSGGESAEVDGVSVTGEEATVTLEPIVVQAVTGYFEIIGSAGGVESAAYTSTPVVTLHLDGFNASHMRLGTSASGAAADCALNPAVSYQAVTTFNLIAEGEAMVCVQFIGGDGRTTDVLTDTIVYDAGVPFGTVLSVNGGAEFVTTAGASVTLALTAFDVLTRLTEMQVANLEDGSCYAELASAPTEPFVTVKSWVLANPANAATGYRTVCARFADAAGNWSTPVSDTVYFDPVLYAPGFSALVRGLEGRTDRTRGAKAAVELAFTGAATDVTGVLISNDASFAGVAWRPFAAATTWTLEAGDGLKTVYVKVRDFAGNESDRLQPQITLDQTGPETPVLALNDVDSDGFPLSSTTAELRWTAPAAPDLAGYEVERFIEGVDTQFGALALVGPGVNTLIDDVAATSGHTHHYRIRARDDLGNRSSYSTVLSARPFTPVSTLKLLRGESEARYYMQPLTGTFLVSTDWLYDNPFPGDAFRDQLGFNVLEWSRSAAFGGFNDEFVVRTSNVDNTLVYESRFAPGHDRRGFDGVPLGGGYGPSLGVAADGSVNIIYSNSGIFHASNAGGVWGAAARYATTLVTKPKGGFAPNGNIFMPYQIAIAFGPTPVDMRINGVWSAVSHPDTDLFNPSEYQAAMDGAGNAYMVYANGYISSSSSTQQGIRYVSRLANGTWSGIVNYDAASGVATALSAARGSNKYCFLYTLAAASLRYGCRLDNGSNYGPLTRAGAPAASATAIGVKSDGLLVLAYVESATGDLKVYDQSTALTTTVHTDAAEPVMAVGADNTVYLAFRSAASKNLMFYHNASGTWTGRTLSSLGDQGYNPSMALGPDGKIHIAYGDQLNGQLGYIVLDPPIAKRFGSNIETMDTATDAAGNIHVAYRNATNDSLYYGLWNGTTFTAQLVDADLSLNFGVGIAVDAAGKAHIAYANEADTAVRYATNAAGSWSAQQAAAFTQYAAPSIALHGGLAHMLASGRYVRGTPGSWVNQVINGQPAGPGDIAVAADGTVHVVSYPFALVDIEDLVHHYGSFGAWSAGFSHTGWYGTPAIGVDAGGKVHITAELANDLVRISGSGSAYTRQTIESGNDVGLGARFAFDAAGRMHLVYADQTNGAIRYATDALTGAFQSIELAKSATLDQSNVFLAPDGSPVVIFSNGGEIVLVSGFNRALQAESVERTTAY